MTDVSHDLVVTLNMKWWVLPILRALIYCSAPFGWTPMLSRVANFVLRIGTNVGAK